MLFLQIVLKVLYTRSTRLQEAVPYEFKVLRVESYQQGL